MKTPEQIKEIKAGLECCASDECHGDNRECPYQYTVICVSTMAGQALSYITELEERISLMLIQMRGDCGCCKHRNAKEEPCRSCLNEEDSPYWKYEGLPVIKL